MIRLYIQSLLLLSLVSITLTAQNEIPAGDSVYNAYFVKILSEIQLGQTHNAIQTTKEALAIFPDNRQLSYILAGQLSEAGQFNTAYDLYVNLIHADSSDISSWIELAESRGPDNLPEGGAVLYG